jgi:tRNA(Ile)-lysidine synthase
MLDVRRSEVVRYLEDIGQSCRFDSSNCDTRFTRNRIRRELLPQLAEQYNPRVVDAVLRLGTLAGELREVVDSLVEDLIPRVVVEERPGKVRIRVVPLAGQPRYVVRELFMALWRRQCWPLQAMGFAQWDSLAELAAPDRVSTRESFPGGIMVDACVGEMVLTAP